MPGDQLVTARHILRVLMEVRGRGAGAGDRGTTRLLEELEAAEPDLTEFILESLLAIDKRLRDAGLSQRQVRITLRESETLVVVAVTALRRAHFELWRDTIQPSSPESPPPPDTPGTT